MARKPRVHFPGALYHVIARGNRRQEIFIDNQDYERYLNFLKEYKEKYDFILYAYALMPNHVHLLIEVREAPLSRLMQSLQFRYTRNFNIKYKTWGHLFQGRYKAILCQKDSYFLELSAYIHLNPVRAGLIEKPLEYPWSSYRFYLKGGGQSLIDPDFLLMQFSRSKVAARRGYANFVKARILQGHRKDLYDLKDQCFLGTEEFVEDIQKWLNDKPASVYEISLKEIVSEVGSVLHIPGELFYGSSRNRQGALGRSVVGYLARNLSGYRIKTVADYFNRDPVVISNGIKRLEARVREDKDIANAVNVLKEALTRNRKPSIAN